MEELVGRIVAKVGVDRPLAETAIGIILEFLSREAPPEAVAPLLTHLPGVQAAIETARENRGTLGIGGIMGVGTRLIGAGLGMDQIQGITREIIAFAREKAGDQAIDSIVRAIPGLSQYI